MVLVYIIFDTRKLRITDLTNMNTVYTFPVCSASLLFWVRLYFYLELKLFCALLPVKLGMYNDCIVQSQILVLQEQ